MASISQLGYIGLGVSDANAWKGLAGNVLGMQIIPGDSKAISYLRMDEFHHRLEINENGTDDLAFLGWEVPDSATLQRVAQQLEDGGVHVVAGTSSDADNRRVGELLKFLDPTGIPTEVYVGRPINPVQFLPTRPMSGYLTGDEGLGHVFVHTSDLDKTVAFYCNLLGFRVTDFSDQQTSHGKLRFAFLHCNARHHSLALMEHPQAPQRINHIMFECNSLADVGTGRDLCLERGVPIAIDLGCHMNDRMTSFYLGNPSKFALELGWGARTVDDATWQTERYSSVASIWGHPQLKEMIGG